MTDMRRLEGKAVIVTGGGSGIGRGACLRIAEEGGLVAVADIRENLAKDVAAEIADAGGSAIAVRCDVAQESDVAEMVAATTAAFGGLHGLVANAGTAGSGWIHETDIDDWNFVLGVNLTGPFLCAKHALPLMIEGGGGSIVITSSIAGSVVGAGGSAASYIVSKHGVIGLAKQIAVDYGAHGIRANAIQPAGVDESNLGKHVAEDGAGAKTPRAQLPRPKPWLPIRRAGRIKDEYGATIAFLLSDDAGYITGTAIAVDGGYLAT
jgi:NAD(P)-dependent dehydrogenase (short-subunit alcohol dehydrogenase family)